MGQEIDSSSFRKRDFEAFREHLEAETALLGEWFSWRRFSLEENCVGFELEAWLVDAEGCPAPLNEAFLAALDSPLASPELARFNVEVNSTPRPLRGEALSLMQAELERTWARCCETAAGLGARMVMIGILPTVRDEHLTLANMSGMERYRALNQQVLRLRRGRPLALDIHGKEHLQVQHRDVMLESAATSFQLHLQVSQAAAVRAYNAATLLSAPMVALSANSPYLFGCDLWEESRIPLFEQAVAVGGFEGEAFGPTRRVTFGSGYARESLFEFFVENLEDYPVLLPVHLSGAAAELPHLRLHNGTVWRWNRPLIGFDESGAPHLRIEHRVVPAGPSVLDTIANAACFFGMLKALCAETVPPERRLPFEQARDNFYAAARNGLLASLIWLDGERVSAQRLLADVLLPAADRGLRDLGVAATEVDHYLGIAAARVRDAQTGAAWQRAHVAAYGPNSAGLLRAYLERQDSGVPVHEWTV